MYGDIASREQALTATGRPAGWHTRKHDASRHQLLLTAEVQSSVGRSIAKDPTMWVDHPLPREKI